MLREVIHYYSDIEPTKEEIRDLEDKSFFEDKVILVDYYCEFKDAIITLEFNDGNLIIRETRPNNKANTSRML